MRDQAAEVAKITPPAGAVGLSVAGIPLQDWVYILTIVYTLLVIFDKFYPHLLAKIGRGVWNWIKEVLK